MFVLFNFIIALAITALEKIAGSPGVVSSIYSLAMLIPSIAVGVSRLHDTNRSGLWLLIIFVPLIGFFVLLYFLVLDSDSGSNEYGPNPKGEY